MKKTHILVFITYISASVLSYGGLFDSVKGVFGGSESSETAESPLTEESILKSMIGQLVDTSFEDLKESYKDISLPDAVSSFESVLASQGKSESYNEYKESVQTAIEKTMPKLMDFAKEHMEKITVDNAKELLDAESPALSNYLKKNSYDESYAYAKSLMDEYVEDLELKEQLDSFVGSGTSSFLSKNLGLKAPDVDISSYLTKESLDMMYGKMAEAETQLRLNANKWPDLYKAYMESE